MKTIEDVTRLDGYGFEDLMNGVRDAGFVPAYDSIIQFVSYNGCTSISEAWEYNCYDVWDAEECLMNYCAINSRLRNTVVQLLNE